MNRTVRILFFLVIVLGCSVALNTWFFPRFGLTGKFSGSDLIYHKSRRLLDEPGRFNTVFLGSSMVFRQINPALFDSTVNSLSNLKTRSFNFGVNWLGSSELFYLLEAITEDRVTRPDYVFVELQKIKTVDYSNYFTTRVLYWYTWKNYLFTIRAVFASTFPWYAKGAAAVSHTVNYLGNLVNIGYLTGVFRYREMQRNWKEDIELTGKAGDGFITLEEQEQINLRRNGRQALERHRRFMADTSVVTARKNACIKAYEYIESHPEWKERYNKIYANELIRLARYHRERGTHLIYFLPPRLDRNQYREMLPIFDRLPAQHRINLSDARRYPEFYLAGYSFDATHMNSTGAALYSVEMARAFAVLKGKK